MIKRPRAWVLGVVLAAGGLMASGQAAPTAAPEPVPARIGQRISLDLKGVDILDVLKLFSQKSGLNFIAGRNVSGRVTIFVNDVDVWDAFELIIGANDLAYERHGTIITVMMARDYELIYGEKFQARTENALVALQYVKVVQVATVLNQVKSSVGRVVADETTNTLILSDVPTRLQEMQVIIKELDRPTETRIYSLNYTEAEKLKEKLQEILSPIGTFTFDARTNKAMITDLREVLARTDTIIKAIDQPDGQVLIDARIIKVDLTDDLSLGIDWTQIFGGDLTTRTNFRALGDVVGGTATGAGVRIFTTKDDFTQIVIDALKEVTHTETLSNPRIMVANNQEAKILVGTKEAVVTVTTTVPATGSTVSSPEIQFVDVGTKLFVTPNVKRDGNIQMKIRPEVSTSTVETFQTNRIPIVTSTEAETNVLVKSGTTVVIGGLISRGESHEVNQVPLLGSLPVVGRMFRSDVKNDSKTELVVFLTPRIILPDGSEWVEPADETPAVALEVGPGGPVPAGYQAEVRKRLQQQLGQQFQRAGLGAGAVVVSFVLDHEGQVVGPADITSRQGDAFVEAARVAFKNSQPFPSFPEGSTATEVRFRMAAENAPAAP
jgi:type II secretory pathway component GspD/PulD (secretin)